MKHFILTTLIGLLALSTGFAQSKTVKKANNLYDLNKFSEAIPLYQKALKKDDNKTIKTKLANCYRRTNQMDKAEQLYLEIIESGRFNNKVLLYYSETLITNEKYDDAKDYLKRYITREPDDEKAHLYLASCEAVKTIEPYFPQFRRKRFIQNSDNDDSSPVYYRNGIAFTSDRNQGAKFLKKKSGWTGRDYAMVYYSAQNIDGTFEIPVSISPKINDLNINSGPISFTADGKYAVFSRNSKIANNSDAYPMQLYSAVADEEGKWKNIELISFCKNTHNYMHPAISPDGQYLYYVTDRRSGQGGTDIYVAKRKTNGSWEKPVNLGPTVNTALNEGFPFAHADGRLFFSSKGQPGYGGFDLFVTKRQANGEWETPVNLGRPVNSSADDVSFFLFEDEKGGFFSSAVGKGNDDIYLFSLEENEDDIFVRLEDSPKPDTEVIADETPQVEENEPSVPPTPVSTTATSTEEAMTIASTPENPPLNESIPDPSLTDPVDSNIGSPPPIVKVEPTVEEVRSEAPPTTPVTSSQNSELPPTSETSTVVEPEAISVTSPADPTPVAMPESNLPESVEMKPTGWQSNNEVTTAETTPDLQETAEIELPEQASTPFEAVTTPVESIPAEETFNAVTTNTSPSTTTDNIPAPIESPIESTTEETQPFEVYPDNPPALEPEIVEDIRPFEPETTSTAKTVDAFGAIQQELVNNTLATGRTFVLAGVKYPFNEFVFQVSENVRYELDRLIYLLQDHPTISLEIGCYSESFGEDSVNRALSRYRAQAAADYLIGQGIARNRITAKGYGESKPLNHCVNGVLCTRDDHLVNQRMEIKILGL